MQSNIDPLILLALLRNIHPHRLQQLAHTLHNNPMILLMLQPTHNHNRNHALNPSNPHRPPTSMNSIFPRPRPQRKFRRKRRLVTLQLVVHVPSALAKAQDRRALARHPRVVVWRGAAVRRRAEDAVLGLCEGDVDHDGGGERQEALADQVAERPGGVGGEVWEDEGGVEAIDLVEVAGREGDFGGHFGGVVLS